MPERPGRGTIVTTILLFAALLAIANVTAYVLYAQSLDDPSFTLAGAGFSQRLSYAFSGVYEKHSGFFWFFLTAPLALVAFIGLLVGLREESAPIAATTTTEEDDGAATAVPGAAALHLLALLQQEGRFIDFVEEELDGYSDEQVGAAVRAIHSGCRGVLHERMDIARIYQEDDGSSLEVDPNYDPNLVRLTGNVHGEPPFRGRLEHGGWKASNIRLPERVDVDPTILAPAEIEVT